MVTTHINGCLRLEVVMSDGLGHEETLGAMETVYILIVVVVTCM